MVYNCREIRTVRLIGTEYLCRRPVFLSHYKFIRLFSGIGYFRMSSSSKRRNSEEEMVGEQIQALIAPPAPDKKQSKASKSKSQCFSSDRL